MFASSAASFTIANRSLADAKSLDGGLCGGWAAGMSTTDENPRASAAAFAQRKWPMWIGLKLPPKQSRELRIRVVLARVLRDGAMKESEDRVVYLVGERC